MGQTAAPTARASGQGHILLLLSLNLILLAFFILLNAISEYQVDRSRAVLKSVDRTFSEGLKVPQAANAGPAALGALPHPRELLREIGSAFEAAIPAARSTLNAQATVLSVDLPAAAFFIDGQARLRPAGIALLRRLAAALADDARASSAYEVAFYHPAAQGGAGGAGGALEVARAALVARRLQRRLSPDAVSVGLQPRLEEVVRFVIRPDRREPSTQGRSGDD